MPEASILNVDDYLPGRYARTRILRRVGFPVIEAGTGEEALRLVEEHRPALVLLDVNLPDIGGIEVCQRIRNNPELARTTILHISASNVQTEHQVTGLESGADGYLVEPIEPEILIATVNAYLRARRAEDALRKSTEELRWFSYRVAHDMNEPLRTIKVYAQMMQHDEIAGDPKSPAAKYLNFIVEAADRMRTFMDGILEYSQVAAVPNALSAIDCEELVNRAVANLDAAIRETGTKIERGPLPSVRADARLEFVFQNLLSNAIKYRSANQPPEIRISAVRDGEFWVFSVRDNGIGIESQYLENVFAIFRRLHGHDIPGSGIGLALCRRIVEAHGGLIWAESAPAVGSTFFFTLPATA